MKIAHIVCVFPPYKGGMGNSASAFADELSLLGHDITVFTPDYGRPAGNNITNYKVFRMKPFFSLGNAAALPQLICHLKKFEIVHLHYPFYGTDIIIWLALVLRKKSKLVIHYHMDSIGNGIKGLIFKFSRLLIWPLLFSLTSKVTMASEDYIRNSQIKSYFKKFPNKFKEVPFGVDTDFFKPAPKNKNKTKQILFVGGLDKAHYFKGLPVLLNALSILKNNHNFNLTIVGSGDLRPEYEKNVDELGLTDYINFTGNIDDEGLAATYRNSDLLVLPSINQGEAFGLVLLEAMSSGLPVVASDLPGVRSVFNVGEEGFISVPGNASDLADKISLILNDDALMTRLSNSARSLVLSKYSWKVVAKQLEKIYEDITL